MGVWREFVFPCLAYPLTANRFAPKFLFPRP